MSYEPMPMQDAWDMLPDGAKGNIIEILKEIQQECMMPSEQLPYLPFTGVYMITVQERGPGYFDPPEYSIEEIPLSEAGEMIARDLVSESKIPNEKEPWF